MIVKPIVESDDVVFDGGPARGVMGQECGSGYAISRCLIVFSTARPGAWAGLVWVVIRVIRLFPRLVGFLLTGSHILVVDLAHCALLKVRQRGTSRPVPSAIVSLFQNEQHLDAT